LREFLKSIGVEAGMTLTPPGGPPLSLLYAGSSQINGQMPITFTINNAARSAPLITVE